MQIKLLTIDSSGYMLEEQLRKISEEHHEAICYADHLPYRNFELASELIDIMQACKTALEMLEKYEGDDEFIQDRINEHIAKLKQRASEGKIKLVEGENDNI